MRIAHHASDKSYQQMMGRLRHQERMLARTEVIRNGPKKQVLTPEEKVKLDEQQHTWLTDLSPEEQNQFDQERQAMWAAIPEHLREKAEKLASGNS